MPSTASLINNLSADFSDITFTKSDAFYWSPGEQTVYYAAREDGSADIFHELGHALLEHTDYSTDISLLAMERDAWEKGREVALGYDISIDEDTIQDHLDTYRDWMHARSTCPSCTATGVQQGPTEYSCLACSQRWRVNEARICGLRRYKL